MIGRFGKSCKIKKGGKGGERGGGKGRGRTPFVIKKKKKKGCRSSPIVEGARAKERGENSQLPLCEGGEGGEKRRREKPRILAFQMKGRRIVLKHEGEICKKKTSAWPRNGIRVELTGGKKKKWEVNSMTWRGEGKSRLMRYGGG